MKSKHTRGESHGCIVCGRPYDLYVVYDANEKYVDAKVMSAGGKLVAHPTRPLVACERHTDEDIARAVQRVYGDPAPEDD